MLATKRRRDDVDGTACKGTLRAGEGQMGSRRMAAKLLTKLHVRSTADRNIGKLSTMYIFLYEEQAGSSWTFTPLKALYGEDRPLEIV